jgi:RNA polymerase sigma-70 factor, ECF subfamily
MESDIQFKNYIENRTFFSVIRLSNNKGKGGRVVDKQDEISRLYDEHSDAILSFILLMVKDYQAAEDLTHDTFIKAYLNYETFRHRSSIKTWLFSIAHNITVDYVRKRKPTTFFKEMFHLISESKQLPEEIIQVKEESQELYNALQKLKDTYRKVIVLRKIKCFSIQDTAKILGWSESKVKSTLHRAIPALKRQLEREGFTNEKAMFRYKY